MKTIADIYEIIEQNGFKPYKLLDANHGGFRVLFPAGYTELASGDFVEYGEHKRIQILYFVEDEKIKTRRIEELAMQELSPKDRRKIRNVEYDKLGLEKSNNLHKLQISLKQNGFNTEIVSDRRSGFRLEIW
jgi:hypothetical protein